MLVLTVRPREYVQIGDNIRVYNKNEEPIQLAFEAPREIQILRPDAKVRQAKPK